MFGVGDEDDADFLSPSGGAKLASLFGLDQVVVGHGNEFFQYTAPKQPKKGQAITAAANQPAQKTPPNSASGGTSTVLAATAVHAYRFTNGQYVKQGKFGAAVLGNHTAKEYRILIYISQQQPITSARIHPNFELTVQPNNYSTFYDDQRQNWSMMFESEKAAVDFNKQICIAKCNSVSSLEVVMSQDLTIGEGPGVQVGDSLEVAYTGWLFQNHGLGQVFDSSVNKDKLLRLKLGSGKVIKGWEDGMIGMRKGGKRLLIIPPSFAYGSEGISGHIPSDSTLIFEMQVKRVKFAKDSGSDGHSINSHDSATPSPTPGADNFSAEPVLLPPTAVPFKPGEPAVRTKSNSISEQLSNPDVTKAKLISRMAKMGQPMLPIVPPHLLDSSDSEIEDLNTLRGTGQHMMTASIHPSPETAHPTSLPRMSPTSQPSVPGIQAPSAALMPIATIQSHSNLPGNSQSFQPYAGMQTYAYHQNATPVTSQLQPVGPMYPGPLSQTPHFQGSADIASLLMTEARQHNTEVRMAVTKVADKVDHLAAKVEELQKYSASNSLLLPGLSVSMETSMIMSNIQRILQENEKLKQEILEKKNRIEEQNDKITDLIERSQRYVEQNNLLMEKRNSTLQIATENTQARVLHAEQEKAKVTEELASVTAQVSNLQLKLTSQQKKETDLQMQLTECQKDADLREAQISKLQAQITELQETSEQAQSQFKIEKQSRKQLELKLSTLEEELIDLQAKKESLEKTLLERKKKSAQERSQAEEEIVEIRKSHQEELEKLRQLLKQAQVSTDQTAAEQVSLMQAELKSQWEAKCEHLLASAKHEHLQQYQAVCEQRNATQQKLIHLEEKLSALEQGQGGEEKKKLLQYQELAEQMQKKCVALQSRIESLTVHYEQKIQELRKQNTPGSEHGSEARDTSEKIKKIMNQVFQSLRGEFELEQSYDGRTILSIVMNTIKLETLLLLIPQESEQESSSEEEEEQLQKPPKEHSAITIPTPSLRTLDREELKPTAKPVEQKDKPESPLPKAFERQNGMEDIYSRKRNSEAEKSLDVPGNPLPRSSARVPSRGIPGPPTSIPPMPPVLGNAVVCEPEYKETHVDNKMKCRKSSLSEEACVGLAEPGTQRQESKKTLQSTTHQAVSHKEREPLLVKPGHSRGEPKPLHKDEEKDCPIATTRTAKTQLNTVVNVAEPAANPRLGHEHQKSSFTDGDEDCLFKGATLKASKPVPVPDDEDEDEVSMKGHPPPAPLFEEDDDDDDLDWLG